MDKEKQFAINRQVVMDGLNRRAEKRAAAEREADLDAFEDAMICRCNAQYDAARIQRRMDAEVERCREQRVSNIAKRAEVKRRKQMLHKDIALSCLVYFAFAVILFWLTTWLCMPIRGTITATAAGAMLLIIRLFQLQREAETEVDA